MKKKITIKESLHNEPKSLQNVRSVDNRYRQNNSKSAKIVEEHVADLETTIECLNRQLAKHKLAEEQLTKSEKKYRVLLENLPQKIFHKDKNSVYVSCNKNYADDLKIKPAQILGKTDYDFYYKELAEKYRADDKRVIKMGTVETIEEKYIQNGNEFIVQTVKAPIQDRKGKVIGILGIFWDITDRKQAEKQLLDYQKRLKALASQITLSEEKERRCFAEYLHDEIGQHLFASQMHLKLLKDSLPPTEHVKTLDKVLNNIEKMIDKSRYLTFELSSPVLYELGLEKALEWLAEQIHKQYNIVVSVEDDKQEKPLDDDIKIFFYRAVSELLTNVIKHAQTKKAIVSIQKDNSKIRISVADHGVGFNPQNEHSSDDKSEGFGLFHINERLEQFGGQFLIESKPNHGTHITLLAPLSNGT
jgi:PAS domain S-box-containing protein